MIRKHLALGAVVLLALAGSAHADRPSAKALDYTVTTDAPECGGEGFSRVELNLTAADFGCIHTSPDPVRTYADGRAVAAGKKPAEAKVPCYGDGTTGPRIQMVYGYHDGLPNRSAAVAKLLRTVMAPRMQAVINAQSHGKDRGLRFVWSKGCRAIDLMVVKFPRSVQYGGNPKYAGGQLARAADYLASLGHERADRKYQILWDGWNQGACGVGFLNTYSMSVDEALEDPISAAYVATLSAPRSPWSDGLPTVGARTAPKLPEGLLSVRPSMYSMVFNHAGGPNGATCFVEKSMSTVTTAVHELFHNLGAVQLDAPHADTGHCSDAPSVMCPGFSVGYGQGVWNNRCARVLVETLDCGEDDYWNVKPAPGSYLATHLNIADSQFFGQQPQDLLVPSPY